MYADEPGSARQEPKYSFQFPGSCLLVLDLMIFISPHFIEPFRTDLINKTLKT